MRYLWTHKIDPKQIALYVHLLLTLQISRSLPHVIGRGIIRIKLFVLVPGSIYLFVESLLYYNKHMQ
jgi:hypothetical protein